MPKVYIRVALLIVLLFQSAWMTAQETRPVKVALQRGLLTLDPYPALAAARGAAADSGLWVVQWAQTTAGGLLSETETVAGFRKSGQLPGGVSLLFGQQKASLQALHARYPIAALRRLEPWWKADAAWMRNASGEVATVVTFPQEIAPARVQADLEKLGAQEVMPDILAGMLRFRIGAAALGQIVQLPYVISVGPASGRIPLNNDERGYSGTALLSLPASLTNPMGRNLSGKNVVVGVGDNSAPMTHVDLASKTINFNPALPADHGTHVSGTVAGGGTIDGAAAGMAPGATVIAALYDLVLQKTPQYRQSYEMNITNNSYAAQVGQCSTAGVYDAYSAAVDVLSRQLPDVLHVFAAGNDGVLLCPPAPGFGNVPGSFQPSKNSLVVGNVQKDMVVRHTSSKGPVRDGRLKPEICAFGTSVYSTYTNNTYAQYTGTSMASPAVAGAAALLTERYKQLHGNRLPTAVLLKGLLAGCADDRGHPGPDYKWGFGMFNLQRSVAALEEGRYESRQVAPVQPGFSATVQIPAGLAEAKILLVWDDDAASPLAAKALLNDLDLTVTDPAGNVLRPLVLNPAQPDAPAQPGIDTLNNIEQVVIALPAAGTYTVQVAGTARSGAVLNAALVYDFVAPGIRLLQPTSEVPVAAGRALNIFWETPESTGPFTLEYSTDNGGSWASIGTAGDSQRAFAWAVPGTLNTAAARVRISRGSDGAESGPFVVNRIPVVTRSASQCPGYFSINWAAIPNAQGYEILQWKDARMTPVDTVLGTTYTLGGLPSGQMQYLAVRPLLQGKRGYRSRAVWQVPDTAKSCGAFAAGDLALLRLHTPATGRVGTQSAFTGGQQVGLLVRNNGPVAATCAVSYRFGNAARQLTPAKTMAANATDTILLPAKNLATVGSYPLDAAIVNMGGTDLISGNDTLKVTLRQLPNAGLNLAAGYRSDFEGSPRLTLTRDSSGLFDGSRWDYSRSEAGYGRLRTFVDTTILILGDRSVSLDADRFFRSSTHYFEGTFNLTGYDIAHTEVRAEFDFMLHGASQYPDSNGVWVRGTDTDPWVVLYAFDTSDPKGVRRNSGSLSVTDVLRASGQQLSSSTAFSFRQKDTTVIAAADYGTGYTLDNFRLYTLGNDIALLSIDTPGESSCGLQPDAHLTITIANGTYQPQYQVPVSYRLDSGPVFTDTIAFFGPKDTLRYSFRQSLQIRDYEPHRLDVWVHYAPDAYAPNDSMLGFVFRQQRLIATFPYLENFEAGSNGWYAEGNNSSWKRGTPQSPNIKQAASGVMAWKTGLEQGYLPKEKSYLYSPCFDLSGMAKPQLSFSLAYDFENCGNAFCDGAWLEWSDDGQTWTRLGLSVEGFNWYDSLQHRAWTGSGQYRWRVSTIGLPTWAHGPIRMRFGMQADPLEQREGLAVDDIYIYDAEGPVFSGRTALVEKTISAVQQVVDFRKNGALMARIRNNSQDLGATQVEDYGFERIVDAFVQQRYLPRSFVVETQKPLSGPVATDFYIAEKDVLQMLADTACDGCPTAPDAYRLGILTYSGENKAEEDDSLANNRDGNYAFTPYTRIAWIPYDSGYIARYDMSQTGEIWFAAGANPYSYPTLNRTLTFSATRKTPTAVSLKIESREDARISRYEIYRSVAGKTPFEKIYENRARHFSTPVTYIAEDMPPAAPGDTVLYQVQWIGRESGLRFRSRVERLLWLPEKTWTVYPNPAPDGRFQLQYSAPVGEQLRLQITDISGKVLFRKEVVNTVFQTILDLPLQLRPGVYLLRTEVEGQVRVERIVAL